MKTPAILAFGTLVLLAGPAFALGDNSSSTGTPTTAQSPAPTCKKGEVLKEVVKNGKKVKICVKAQSGILPDEELYQQGKLLAKAGEYDWAIQVLSVIQNQDDPRVLNYLGYSNRKAGRLDIGIGYYKKALAINPNFVLAREYLGEGYVAAGRSDLARAELQEIAKRCGTTCEEYRDLAEAIAGAQ